ncbi:hypothetical protein [Ruania halotolerans]|uniref:hypothetical protein n=1 Tax=Ruania halotolerans TaxID=2897773 RepID=UPI001E395DA7|nr:hypothetical protein [Ruania halotolerans]UFU06587.1 hypothetical protein LQF10_00285 [Ruania halotolerans]
MGVVGTLLAASLLVAVVAALDAKIPLACGSAAQFVCLDLTPSDPLESQQLIGFMLGIVLFPLTAMTGVLSLVGVPLPGLYRVALGLGAGVAAVYASVVAVQSGSISQCVGCLALWTLTLLPVAHLVAFAAQHSEHPSRLRAALMQGRWVLLATLLLIQIALALLLG